MSSADVSDRSAGHGRNGRRTYDILVLGTTETWGRFIMDFLMQATAVESVAIVCNGAKVSRIRTIAAESEVDIDVFGKDYVMCSERRIELIRQSICVLNFWENQNLIDIDSLIASCIASGTHYIDNFSDVRACERVERDQYAAAFKEGVIVLMGIGYDMVLSDLVTAWILEKSLAAKRVVLCIDSYTENFDAYGRARLRFPLNNKLTLQASRERVALRGVHHVAASLIPKSRNQGPPVKSEYFQSNSLFYKDRNGMCESVVLRSLAQLSPPLPYSYLFNAYYGVDTRDAKDKHSRRPGNSPLSSCYPTDMSVGNRKIVVAKTYGTPRGDALREIKAKTVKKRKPNYIDAYSISGPEQHIEGNSQIIKLIIEVVMELHYGGDYQGGVITPSKLLVGCGRRVRQYLRDRAIIIEEGIYCDESHSVPRSLPARKKTSLSCCDV